ncbi:MAG: hypothetical protein ACFFB0_07010 [Promethearchaeota archaeon]
MVVYCKTNKVQIVCPICNTRDIIGIPEREIKKNNHLTTVSIHKGLLCPHHFQVFVDKNFQIRGYQKVDFELNQENSIKLRNGVKAFNNKEKDNSNSFEEISLEGNNINYYPLNNINSREDNDLDQKTKNSNKQMSLREIYEEFWEFIDDDNKIFRKFIIKDKKRRETSKYLDFHKLLIA